MKFIPKTILIKNTVAVKINDKRKVKNRKPR